MAKANKRIKELEEQIKYHQSLYYNEMPEISDGEFDLLWDELKSLDPENPILTRVGADSIDGFVKEKHIIPMGSQAKAADSEEFLAWCNKSVFPEYVVQYKMDGASIELQYFDGVFFKAVTRGDGIIGDDITANVALMNGFPKKLKEKWTGAVRGEVLMSKEVHDKYFSDKANCRNAANGTMKRKDGSGCEKLDIVTYDCSPLSAYQETNNLFSGVLESPFDDECKKIEWLKENGFYIVEMKVFHSPSEIIDYRTHVVSQRNTLSYDIDGLVIKAKKVDIDDMKRTRPERQIAFKFPLEEAISTLLEVQWSESGASFTPVGIIEPVRLAGTTVKRASLANPGIIRNLGLKIGSKVVVVKRGEIIPKIDGVLENNEHCSPIVQPTVCSCGASLIDEQTRLYCPNPACPKKALHRIQKWLSVLDVLELGNTILSKLFNSGRVKDISDLYSLSVEELSLYERMGELSASKIIKNLDSKNTISLAQFIAGFDIEGIGLLMLEKLCSSYSSLEEIRKASPVDFQNVDGFAEISAQKLYDGLQMFKNEMDKVLSSGKIIISAKQEQGLLSGLSFCFTGELNTMKRAEAQALVKSLGGIVKSSVTKDLSYLVTNDTSSGSSKNVKASSLGVKIIDEKAFIALTKAY